jgi:multidrug efflux pump subunit AcrB
MEWQGLSGRAQGGRDPHWRPHPGGPPGRRNGGRQALEGRRHSEDPVGSAALLVVPAAEMYGIQRIEPSVPQKFIDVDRDKVLKQGVNLTDVYRTIQAFMGGYFINYFNRLGRQWQVYIEAEAQDRADVNNVGRFYVLNNKGESVPLSTFTTINSRVGPEFTQRFNEYRSAQINGSAAPGYSADQATAALEEVFRQTMPREMGFDYSGISFQEQKAREGVPPSAIFGLSLLFVLLILAALYESWSLPFSVLLSTPVAVFGAFAILCCVVWFSDIFCRLTWCRSRATFFRKSAWSCSSA